MNVLVPDCGVFKGNMWDSQPRALPSGPASAVQSEELFLSLGQVYLLPPEMVRNSFSSGAF